jgi:outer membrane lipoprotein SlyB
MKKVAVTVAVLALGLAACAKNDNANNEMTANDTYSENATGEDMNAATPENVAENALENIQDQAANAQDAVQNMADNATTNQ